MRPKPGLSRAKEGSLTGTRPPASPVPALPLLVPWSLGPLLFLVRVLVLLCLPLLALLLVPGPKPPLSKENRPLLKTKSLRCTGLVRTPSRLATLCTPMIPTLLKECWNMHDEASSKWDYLTLPLGKRNLKLLRSRATESAQLLRFPFPVENALGLTKPCLRPTRVSLPCIRGMVFWGRLGHPIVQICTYCIIGHLAYLGSHNGLPRPALAVQHPQRVLAQTLRTKKQYIYI